MTTPTPRAPTPLAPSPQRASAARQWSLFARMFAAFALVTVATTMCVSAYWDSTLARRQAQRVLLVGDALRTLHAPAHARPHRKQEKESQRGDPEEQGIARPARQARRRNCQGGSRQRHDKGAQSSPAPAAKRQADRAV